VRTFTTRRELRRCTPRSATPGVTLSTNSSGVYLTGWIAIGNYTVQVSKSGYATQSKGTSMSSGQTATVNFTLQ